MTAFSEFLAPGEVGLLLRGLDDRSVAVRVATFDALSLLPLSPADWRAVGRYATRVLADGTVADSTVAERLAVVRAGPLLPLRSVRERIAELVDAPDVDLRESAVAAAIAMGHPRGVPALLRASGAWRFYRIALVDVAPLVDIVRAAYHWRTDPEERFWLALALALSGFDAELKRSLAGPDRDRIRWRELSARLAEVFTTRPLPAPLAEWISRRRAPGAPDRVAALITDPQAWPWLAARVGPALRPVWAGGRNPGFAPRSAARPDVADLPDLAGLWLYPGPDGELPDEVTDAVRRIRSEPLAVTVLMERAANLDDDVPWHDFVPSNRVAELVGLAGSGYRPDVDGLYVLYRRVSERAWQEAYPPGSAEDTAIAFHRAEHESGPRPFCYQIGWLVSRGGLPGLITRLAPRLRSTDVVDRIVAAHLVADAAVYVRDPDPMRFGGSGIAPDRPTMTDLLDEVDAPTVVDRDRPEVPEPAPPRYLHTELPERVETGRRLALRVSIVRAPAGGAVLLRPLPLPPHGATVTVVVTAPDLVLDGDTSARIHVPAGADSDPHLFLMTAGRVGRHPVRVELFRNGSYLGGARLEVLVERSAPATAGRDRFTELSTLDDVPGEVTLQVNRGPDGYVYQLLGNAWYDSVTMSVGDPTRAVGQLADELNAMAAGRSPFTGVEAVRRRIRALGVQLWAAAVPPAVQQQFWEQAGHVGTLTVAGGHDAIPWELLYPVNGSNDNGFLADQFPLVRRVLNIDRVAMLPAHTAAYVVPPRSPEYALAEVAAIRQRLAGRVGDHGTLAGLLAVQDLLADSPGILHFACHNTFSATDGSSILLDGGPWRPSDLAVAVQQVSLAQASPLVFLNACRSAGEASWLSRMTGWAVEFMRAGAGAFVGSLWAVRSSSARTFAEEFYLWFIEEGRPLGEASWLARQAIALDDGDPTWLAYTVYGNPAAVAAPARRPSDS